jgi:two-component system competent response regulator ComA
MKQVVRALVVDDHPLMAEATKLLLEQIEGIEVIGIAVDGRMCMELVESHLPELIFLDYQLPDQTGTEIAAQIKIKYPQIHIVIFTGVDVSALINKFIELQVSGVISKGTRHAIIKNIIGCILDNHMVFPRSSFNKLKLYPKLFPENTELTKEEITIMNLIVKGATLDQIAVQIHTSKRSIDNYQRKIYEKFGVKTRVEAIGKFLQSEYYQDAAGGK